MADVNKHVGKAATDLEQRWGLKITELYQIALKFFKDKDGSKALLMSYNDRLKMVALTKQVVHGKYTPSLVPDNGLFDVVGNNRRQAWQLLGDMSPEEAMCQFINSLDRLCPLFIHVVEAHKVEKEEAEKKKREEQEEVEQLLKVKVEEELKKQQEAINKQLSQETLVRNALNQQTYNQFRLYAQLQHPNNVPQQDALIAQLQEQHFIQYMQHVYAQQQQQQQQHLQLQHISQQLQQQQQQQQPQQQQQQRLQENTLAQQQTNCIQNFQQQQQNGYQPQQLQQQQLSTDHQHQQQINQNLQHILNTSSTTTTTTTPSQQQQQHYLSNAVSAKLISNGVIYNATTLTDNQAAATATTVSTATATTRAAVAATTTTTTANMMSTNDNDVNADIKPGLFIDGTPKIETASLWTRKDLKNFKESLKAEHDSTINIGSGELVTVRVPTHVDGSSLFWEFATDGFDIGFGLSFEWGSCQPLSGGPCDGRPVRCTPNIPESSSSPSSPKNPDTNNNNTATTNTTNNNNNNNDDAHPKRVDVVVPIVRRQSQSEVQCGSHVYPGMGVYLLMFDNSYSLWRSKTIYYRVYYSQ